MPLVTASSPEVLVVTGGHRVAFAEFSTMFDDVCASLGWRWEHAEQPAAQALLHPDHVGRWRTIVLHDIPGLLLRRGEEPTVTMPDLATRTALAALLDAGQGLVVTHHSLAGWPAWDGWAHAVGGRFLYAPGSLDGRPWPSSGYRVDRHHVRVVAPQHPVCAGVTDFDLDDELYLQPVFEGEFEPLLVTDDPLDPATFRSTYDEVRHGVVVPCADTSTIAADARPSRAVGWVKVAGRSPLVYLQPGHGPETFAHPAYRRLLTNAMSWTASTAAHTWAAAHPTRIDVGT